MSTTAVTFPLSPIPQGNLGKHIRTAAALIIGDEILNGKTLDRNSHCFAKYCFEQGIDLKRIEVIADNEGEIIEASRRLVSKYDFVVTSGGIGPTHDDITYESLAKSFNQKLAHHEETIRRMSETNRYRKWVGTKDPQQLAATHRMALFPESAEVIYVEKDVWVPVVRLEGKLCVFPGIPALFQKMLYGLTPFLPLPPKQERPLRIQIFTERPESMIAPYLASLQARFKPHGIQVGSYPVLYKGVFVSLIGRDNINEGAEKIWLADVAREVEKEVGGRVTSEEEIAAQKRASVALASEHKDTGTFITTEPPENLVDDSKTKL
ncbi:Molybdopterin binding protein [Phlegmacium glaucopus]|nr:Molybdopterin binding protein [Phlegmacium glaucopus]